MYRYNGQLYTDDTAVHAVAHVERNRIIADALARMAYDAGKAGDDRYADPADARAVHAAETADNLAEMHARIMRARDTGELVDWIGTLADRYAENISEATFRIDNESANRTALDTARMNRRLINLAAAELAYRANLHEWLADGMRGPGPERAIIDL